MFPTISEWGAVNQWHPTKTVQIYLHSAQLAQQAWRDGQSLHKIVEKHMQQHISDTQ